MSKTEDQRDFKQLRYGVVSGHIETHNFGCQFLSLKVRSLFCKPNWLFCPRQKTNMTSNNSVTVLSQAILKFTISVSSTTWLCFRQRVFRRLRQSNFAISDNWNWYWKRQNSYAGLSLRQSFAERRRNGIVSSSLATSFFKWRSNRQLVNSLNLWWVQSFRWIAIGGN